MAVMPSRIITLTVIALAAVAATSHAEPKIAHPYRADNPSRTVLIDARTTLHGVQAAVAHERERLKNVVAEVDDIEKATAANTQSINELADLIDAKTKRVEQRTQESINQVKADVRKAVDSSNKGNSRGWLMLLAVAFVLAVTIGVALRLRAHEQENQQFVTEVVVHTHPDGADQPPPFGSIMPPQRTQGHMAQLRELWEAAQRGERVQWSEQDLTADASAGEPSPPGHDLDNLVIGDTESPAPVGPPVFDQSEVPAREPLEPPPGIERPEGSPAGNITAETPRDPWDELEPPPE